ncbi:nitrous oxide reductase accessory protein NosL [Flavobacteriaceae bacterium F08102]|nr:nitrous oxide reductase accessory protein NosL [Flavobacteriaceae bacterium F08102]
MKYLYSILISALLFASCTVKPTPIVYGKDACHYCTMTIVDQQFAAEIVTKKGKAFKYDAIECMVNDLKNTDQHTVALFLVTDYLNPKTLIDARKATYLISPEIKSPMGANLSAFSSKESMHKQLKITSNKLLNWTALQQQDFK